MGLTDCIISKWKSSNRHTAIMMTTLLFLILSVYNSDGLVIHVCSSNSDNYSCSLEYYASHIPRANNTLLILDEGTHLLHLNESIRFDKLNNFSIVGSGRPGHSTKIQCMRTSGLLFSNIHTLYITGFSLINCGGTILNDSSISAALVIRGTFNTSIENVIVKNCTHYGMMGINMLGVSSIYNSLFISNTASYMDQPGGNMLLSWSQHHGDDNIQCDLIHLQIDSSQFINGHGGQNRAGGLLIDYQNSCNTSQIITITNSIFRGNKGGNVDVVIHQSNPNHRSFFQLNLIMVHIVGGIRSSKLGSGGFSLLLKGNANMELHTYLPAYYLTINDSVFTGNTDNYSSGGVYLNSTQNLMSWAKFSAVFHNCSFNNNSGFEGGALGLHFKSLFTNVVLSSCTFDGNVASRGGAILSEIEANAVQNASIFQSRFGNAAIPMVLLMGCAFQGNVAFESGSVLIIDNPSINHSGSLNFFMNNTIIQQNKITSSIQISDLTNSSNQQAFIDATVILKNTNTVINNCSFLNNIGSAIYASKLELHFANFIVIAYNKATSGGGIQLSKAKLHLSKGTMILLKNNHAAQYGGAVYVNDNIQGCFVTKSSSESGPLPGEIPQPSLSFINNSAAYSGNNMYGSEAIITSCLKNNETASMFNFQYLNKLSTTLSLELESTTQVCMCYANNTPNCDVVNTSKEVFPGGVLSLTVATLATGEMVPRVINAELQDYVSSDNMSTSFLTGGLQITRQSCTHLNYTLSSNSTTEIITLTVVGNGMARPFNVIAHLLSCPLGFSIQATSPECGCISQLTQLGVACNIQDQTFEHSGNIWIGMYNDSGNNTYYTLHTLISSDCPFDYCNLGYVRMVLEDADKQCSFNRSGILCGGCLPGLSASLGATNCIQCENKAGIHTALFVFLFSTAGIVLIAFLRLCNLTISQGSANPVMFYANVIHVNGTFFFERRRSNPLTVFVSWFNLDFGFETCFYNGMDASAKAWLQFAFPLYLWVMIAIIYIASQQSSKFVRLMGRNSHSIILTLLHLSFFKLYRATVAVLLFTDLQNENGEHLRVWRYNGNVNYYSRKHTPLLAFAVIVLVLFVIPYALIMICTPLIIRKGYQVRCINFWRLKPFLDAYTGLYKDKAMFWNGLTTVIYTILLVTSTEVDAILNLVIIALSSMSLVFLNFAFGGVYRKWILSVMEATVHTNLICLSILSLLSLTKGQSVTSVVYTSTAVSFILFMGVVIINSIKELSKASRTIKAKLFSLVKWCDHKLGRDRKYRRHCHKSNKHYGSGKESYNLDYYMLAEDSAGGYYATDNRDDILTTVHLEEDSDDALQLLPLPVSSAPTVAGPVIQEYYQEHVIPNDNKAITFSIVALEDDVESEEGITEKHSDSINEGQTKGETMLTAIESVTEISEVRIDIDEHLPLLSPCIESPQNAPNYLTFDVQESPGEKVKENWDVCHSQESFSLPKFQKLSTYHPLDSDIDATGQRPSLVNLSNHKYVDHLQRLTDPIELAVVDKGESEEDETVQTKIHQLNPYFKKIRSSRKEKADHSKGTLKLHYGRSESQSGETIPLLPLKKDRQNLMYTSNANPEMGTFTSTDHKCQIKEHEHHSFEACSSSTNYYCADWQYTSMPLRVVQTIGTQLAISIPFLKPIEVISVTSKGVEYSCEEYGVRVKVPEGALPPMVHSSLEIGIASHGPFEFPAGMIPISPILWICMPHESLLSKPVEITLPHCLTDLSEHDPVKQDIGFLKANHHYDYSLNSNGGKVYQFREAEGGVTFPDPTSGVLYTKQFCFKCLKVNVTPESTKKRGYCLIYGIPKPWPKLSAVDINIGIIYFLQTCIETFKKQITDKDPNMDFDFHCKLFHFKDASQPVKVAIKFDPSKQWIVIVQDGEEGIRAEEVDFWNKDESLLKTMEDNNAYPPRFVLSVCKNGARSASVVNLHFEGTRESVKINIILQHIVQGKMQKQLNSEGASTASSISSTQQMDIIDIGSDFESEDDIILCKEPELAEFMNEVANKINPMKWMQLGIQLRLDITTLDQIGAQLSLVPSMTQCDTAFMRIFITWKKNRPSAFAWGTLITVLRTPSLGEQTLARELQTKLKAWYGEV